MNDQEVDNRLKELGKNAPRVTRQSIDAKIKNKEFWNPANTTLTVCVLTLENGFTVTGTSASASPENFVRDIGEELAYQKAVDEVWKLEGYLLTQRLYESRNPEPQLQPVNVLGETAEETKQTEEEIRKEQEEERKRKDQEIDPPKETSKEEKEALKKQLEEPAKSSADSKPGNVTKGPAPKNK